MTIQALSSGTVKLIGASQVLTDPASVIKELIDNSLDARASSIFIDISINTLDVIQVRDNGHGIVPEDREMLCKRHCTSKIRHQQDLKDVGGKWLGFRGEALASAAELSGGLTLTTRVEGEDVATCLNIARTGEIQGREGASHPPGTTVRLTDLLNCIPVRRQTALKATVKCLAKLKKILYSCALARPNVRFCLKVLKAKNDKGNWMYAPKAGASVEDAALKIVGKECASQCIWVTHDHDGSRIEALLPRPDSDQFKISNIGHFLSVDSRPVSTGRSGTILNRVFKLFKERLKASNGCFDKIKDPFLCMNIVCAVGSYDVNVEPAKDDVVFEDGAKIIEAVKQLLDRIYTQQQTSHDTTSAPKSRQLMPTSSPRSQQQETSLERPAERHPNMSNNDEGDTDIASDQVFPQQSVSGEDAENRFDVQTSNPWTLAKVSAPVQRHMNSPPGLQRSRRPLGERGESEKNSRGLDNTPSEESSTIPPHPPWTLPTPQPSSPIRPTSRHAPSKVSSSFTTDRDESASLNTPRASPNRPSLARFDIEIPRQLHQDSQQSGWTIANDVSSARRLQHGTQATPSTSHRARETDRRQNITANHLTYRAGKLFNPPTQARNHPFKSPLKLSTHPARPRHSNEIPPPQATQARYSRPNRNIRDFLPQSDFDLPPQGNPRTRKRRRRSPDPTQDQEADFSPIFEDETPPGSLEAVEDHDRVHPRIRRVGFPPPEASSHGAPRPRRSARAVSPMAHLPLERIPTVQYIGDAATSLKTSVAQVERAARLLRSLGLEGSAGIVGYSRFDNVGGSRSEWVPSLRHPPPGDEEMVSWREIIEEFLSQQRSGGMVEDTDARVWGDEGVGVREIEGEEAISCVEL